jgi:uncharacterized Zn finger protein
MDSELTFSIQGSAPEPYVVRFIRRNDRNLTASCSCPAGAMGQYCKHRFGILGGDASGIVSNNAHEVPTIVSWLSGSEIEKSLRALTVSEAELEAAKKRVAAAKKAVARAMAD